MLNRYSGSEIVNIGVGKDISIRELAELIRDVVGYRGEIFYDTSKPDGIPHKLPDVRRSTASVGGRKSPRGGHRADLRVVLEVE